MLETAIGSKTSVISNNSLLAGGILPALKMAICWEPLFYSLAPSAGNLEGLILLRILRDYMPESFCCGFIFNTPLCKSAGSKNFNRTSLHKVRLGSAGGQPCLYAPRLFKRTKYTLSSDLSGEDKHFNNLPFFSYLTGLIEGGGTILVPKTERSTKGVLNYAAWWFRKSFVWQKLSNSKDTLKFFVPNYIRNYISGWSNLSGKVISQEMIEREIGYCGYKSCRILRRPVKEQRVDGSYIGQSMLRCTLMGFERSCFLSSLRDVLMTRNQFLGKLAHYPINCQVKILSNHLNNKIRYFSSLITSQSSLPLRCDEVPFNINPWFITGLVDGEGSFIVGVSSNKNYKTGWNIKTRFQIALHQKDIDLLLQIKNYFGVGKIAKHQGEVVAYRVESIKELEIIINHFDKYSFSYARVR